MANDPQFNRVNLKSINKVIDRFIALGGRDVDRLALQMDLCAADGENGNRHIDWKWLLDASDFDLLHDVGGIRRHMDRDTGQLGNCFMPRATRVPSQAGRVVA